MRGPLSLGFIASGMGVMVMHEESKTHASNLFGYIVSFPFGEL
jgi:hypothetical protein